MILAASRRQSQIFARNALISLNSKLTLPPSRTYVISRFPKRTAGVSRDRPQSQPKQPDIDDREQQAAACHASVSERALETLPISDRSDGLNTMLLRRNTLVIERQLEMLNVFIGFEQSNKYTISDADGRLLGYIAEEPRNLLGTLSRQIFATHRPFRAVIMDAQGAPMLWIRRPFAFINSRMFVQRLKDHSKSPFDPDPVLETFGEVQQLWHPWRRRYDLFLREYLPSNLADKDIHQARGSESSDNASYYQVAKVDSGFLAWKFRVLDEHEEEIASIDRAFRGIGREIFTDTGKYSLHFETSGVQTSLPNSSEDAIQNLPRSTIRELNIDTRALLLALAVNIDFDYFSRHSHTTGYDLCLPHLGLR